MRYLVTLRPLEPFMFGGDQTFGALGVKEAGSYLVKSRTFPQQTAILGMLKKELMTQAGVLTRKRKGEWVDKEKHTAAKALVGSEKFNMLSETLQDFGSIQNISPVFLMKQEQRYIKKVDSDSFPYVEGKLENYDPKNDIYDNFVSLDGAHPVSSEAIFKAVEQTGNKKGGEENSLFKKTSLLLKDGFTFAFYIDMETELKSALVTLGADRSSFMMQVKETTQALDYHDKNGYLTLLSDAYITLDIKEHARFAITSELSHRNLTNKKHVTKKNAFEKSDTLYLYEKGSVFIDPSDALIRHINNENLQQIGYNIYTIGEKK
ncbi:type III-B CRISPR module-associated Cmr3 family protein [Sulfurovum sp.]|uniref:type III-B CRISPR module-associated Cmr3 family protein n=1 Tax=Sulfurovum sp. TaxID=1969726 RepID=UPI0025D7FC0A|nr:type III-B CRISPR module-associated Cmr3 family protein [Sulfurovum sp.]